MWRRSPYRRTLAAGSALAAVVATVVLAGCSSKPSRVISSQLTTPSTASNVFNPLPRPTVPPGADACPQLPGTDATLTINDNGLATRCITLTTKQKLQIKNTGKQFHNIQIEDLNANLGAGDTQYFDTLGKYLDPGIYLIWSWSESDVTAFPNFNGTLVLKAA